jgi:PIN domain nuclease of toxin-antitoxin system
VRYLLDTHAALWWLFDDPRLPTRARALLAERRNEMLISAASAWEIATKHRLGKLECARELVKDMTGWFRRARFTELPVTVAHAQRAGSWTQPHRDPFDRMLAAQSILEDVPLISRDQAFAAFGVALVWG